MIIGEGEEVNNEVLELFRQARKSGWSKTQFLEAAAKIQGVLASVVLRSALESGWHAARPDPDAWRAGARDQAHYSGS